MPRLRIPDLQPVHGTVGSSPTYLMLSLLRTTTPLDMWDHSNIVAAPVVSSQLSFRLTAFLVDSDIVFINA